MINAEFGVDGTKTAVYFLDCLLTTHWPRCSPRVLLSVFSRVRIRSPWTNGWISTIWWDFGNWKHSRILLDWGPKKIENIILGFEISSKYGRLHDVEALIITKRVLVPCYRLWTESTVLPLKRNEISFAQISRRDSFWITILSENPFPMYIVYNLDQQREQFLEFFRLRKMGNCR